MLSYKRPRADWAWYPPDSLVPGQKVLFDSKFRADSLRPLQYFPLPHQRDGLFQFLPLWDHNFSKQFNHNKSNNYKKLYRLWNKHCNIAIWIIMQIEFVHAKQG